MTEAERIDKIKNKFDDGYYTIAPHEDICDNDVSLLLDAVAVRDIKIARLEILVRKLERDAERLTP